jgi:hypothetical protein
MLAAQGIGQRHQDVQSAVCASAGIYGAAPTSHFSLAARVAGYAQPMLEHAMVVDRSVVRVSAMRSSTYLLPADLVLHGVAMVSHRTMGWFERILGMGRAEYERVAGLVVRALADSPGTAADIRTRLGDDAPGSPDLSYLLRQMGHEGLLLKTATRGGIRSQSFEYAALDGWIDVASQHPSLDEALDRLVPRWLNCHGPGSVADLAWWAGVKADVAAAALERSGQVSVVLDHHDQDLWWTEAALDTQDRSPDGLHLLPVWDVYLMSHRDRRRYLSEAHRPFVVDPSGNVASVVVDDGRVVGIWDVDGPTLLVGSLPGEVLDSANALEAAQTFAGIAPVDDVGEVAPRLLAGRGQNAFQAPLRR